MKKILLSLSAPMLALSPVVAVMACGKKETNKELDAANAAKTALAVLAAPATANKTIEQIGADVSTETEFTSTISTKFGLSGTYPALAEGVTAVYTLKRNEVTAADFTVTYSLKIWGKKGTTKSAKSHDVTLAASDKTSAEKIANAAKNALTVLVAPATANKTIAQIGVDVAETAFTSVIATNLGLTGTYPALVDGATAVYTLTKNTPTAGSPATYSLKIWGKKGDTKSTESHDVTLTSSDNVPAATV